MLWKNLKLCAKIGFDQLFLFLKPNPDSSHPSGLEDLESKHEQPRIGKYQPYIIIFLYIRKSRIIGSFLDDRSAVSLANAVWFPLESTIVILCMLEERPRDNIFCERPRMGHGTVWYNR